MKNLKSQIFRVNQIGIRSIDLLSNQIKPSTAYKKVELTQFQREKSLIMQINKKKPRKPLKS